MFCSALMSKLSVRTPEENGRRKTFRTGEQVQVDIQADYYFGGAVADANVEVLVFQKPFLPIWRPMPECQTRRLPRVSR